MSALTLITAPSSECVTLAEAKAQLRSLTTDEDTLISALILAARSHCEDFTGRKFIAQTWEVRFDYDWPTVFDRAACGNRTRIVLPIPGALSVTTVKYTDTSGAQQTLASNLYSFTKGDIYGFIEPAYGASWPAVRNQLEAVQIQFVAGFGSDATFLPPAVKQAILLLIGHFNENREAVLAGPRAVAIELPFTIQALLKNYVTDGW